MKELILHSPTTEINYIWVINERKTRHSKKDKQGTERMDVTEYLRAT